MAGLCPQAAAALVPRCGDALLIVPPFAAVDMPALGPHVVQASARAAGFRVAVLYASLWFAAEIGELEYQRITQTNRKALLGERFFARLAYPSLAADAAERPPLERFASLIHSSLSIEWVRAAMERAAPWLDALMSYVGELDYSVVGCSSSFEQTAASAAILSRVKQRWPRVTTVLGGANCEGEMANGLLSLDVGIDHVFAGESEATFVEFLRTRRAGGCESRAIVPGRACVEMDALPTPDFGEFYAQAGRLLPHSVFAAAENVWLPYESSRGCWWGQKHHCTFCGLSEEAITFRAKSPERVLGELRTLMATHPTNKLCAVDYIMPRRYFRELLPRMAAELPPLHAFYFVKANLRLAQVRALAAAGVVVIQPGIEALATPLLRRMAKGVTARQNVELLRWARACGVAVNWNLLFDLPGDERESYLQTLALLPYLRHLHPPIGMFPLMVDRFSPYFDHPQAHGLANLRPFESYAAVLPPEADVDRIAYHFEADYVSAARTHPDTLDALRIEVARWRAQWESPEAPPALVVTPLSAEHSLLIDTRSLPGVPEFSFIDARQSALALAMPNDATRDELAWARERGVAIEIDGQPVSLATAEPDVLAGVLSAAV